MSQTNIDCVVSGDAPSEHKSGIAEKSRRWLVKTPHRYRVFAAAQLTAKGIRKFRLETGLRRVNFIAASETSQSCCCARTEWWCLKCVQLVIESVRQLFFSARAEQLMAP
jgi:hypothetical protein